MCLPSLQMLKLSLNMYLLHEPVIVISTVTEDNATSFNNLCVFEFVVTETVTTINTQ